MSQPNSSDGLVGAWLTLVGATNTSWVTGGLDSGPADLGWGPLHVGDPRAVDWSNLALAAMAETTWLSSMCLSHLSSRLAGGEGRSPREGRLLQACFQDSV